jgi:glutathione S-transferase
MSLTLHFHPLSSYCHKTLIALYENATSFSGHPHLEAYFARLTTRPSYARVLKEAEPYFSMFPAS